jgi:hypothetical protein
MWCIGIIQAKSTPEASNQTADAEEVEEKEINILLNKDLIEPSSPP